MSSNFIQTLTEAKTSESLVEQFLSDRGWYITNVSDDILSLIHI